MYHMAAFLVEPVSAKAGSDGIYINRKSRKDFNAWSCLTITRLIWPQSVFARTMDRGIHCWRRRATISPPKKAGSCQKNVLPVPDVSPKTDWPLAKP